MSPSKRIISRPVMITTGFYMVCMVVALSMWGLSSYINGLQYVLAPSDDPAALSKAQDAYAAMNNLLTTLATGLLAAMGWFVTSKPDRRYSARTFWPAIVSALCVCISLYWGYISSQNVEWAIEHSIGAMDLEKIQLPRQLQFLTILLGVVFFADFVRRDLTKVD